MKIQIIKFLTLTYQTVALLFFVLSSIVTITQKIVVFVFICLLCLFQLHLFEILSLEDLQIIIKRYIHMVSNRFKITCTRLIYSYRY